MGQAFSVLPQLLPAFRIYHAAVFRKNAVNYSVISGTYL